MSNGKYRLRTALRANLPDRLSMLIPKGGRDCGNHEWYLAEPETWHCYHCRVGVTHWIPWDRREFAARQLEAQAMLTRICRPYNWEEDNARL